jgi:hypothetical protein
VPPTKEAPAKVAAPLRKSRLSTKLFLAGTGIFSLGISVPPGCFPSGCSANLQVGISALRR